MIQEIIQEADERMQKSITTLKAELSKLRTGRAHPSLLEHITVEYYGSQTPLSQVANVNIADARTLTITPWDKNMVGAIEKAILTSDLGLNPATAGQVIRVPMPPLTEQRRKELGKVVRNEGENAKIAIRNIRRDANNTIKELLKDKAISEDEERRAQERVQKLTDKLTEEVDKIVEAKENDLMEI